MQRTERVHLLFRGASEITKWLRRFSFYCELGAAAVSLYAILAKPKGNTAEWLPFAVLALALLGVILRSYSSMANGFAQRCRKISLRAYCLGKDVDVFTATTLEDDAPPLIEALAGRLKIKTIDEYYDPKSPAGTTRMAELYAHSGFFTWRLLQLQAVITFVIGIIVAVFSLAIIYHLAAQPQLEVDRQAILEAVCGVAVVVVTVRCLQASWEAFCSYREIRSIENALLKRPTGDALIDLMDSYDIERAAGANPSTLLYDNRRGALKTMWEMRRQNFI